ncbi:MAG: hypothetical protein QW117_02810 [Candidatus Pacearchaeota archaeon]
MKKENLISRIEGDKLINEIKEKLENEEEIIIEVIGKMKEAKEIYKKILFNFKSNEYKVYYLNNNSKNYKNILYHIIIGKIKK